MPTDAALRAIQDTVRAAAASGLVEIGAGTGYWAWLLRERGVDIVAYDRRPPSAPAVNGHHAVRYQGEAVNAPPFVEVVEGGPEMAAMHPDRALFLCWPPQEQEEEEEEVEEEGLKVEADGEEAISLALGPFIPFPGGAVHCIPAPSA